MVYATGRGGVCGRVHPAVSSSPAGESYPRLFFPQWTNFVSRVKPAILITGKRFSSARFFGDLVKIFCGVESYPRLGRELP